jgi:hypothetical protein
MSLALAYVTRRCVIILAFVCFILTPAQSRCECVRLEIKQREPFADGKAFGKTGPYERIEGIAHFAIDPALPRNQVIVDLDLAPRNADGKVEFSCDFFILAPKDPAKGNGAILYDVNNPAHRGARRRRFPDASGVHRGLVRLDR